MPSTQPWTRADLRSHIEAVGIARGDAVLVHAGLRSVGPILGGPDTLIGALIDAVGYDGTILAYCDWQSEYYERDDLRPHVPPFDPHRSRAIRDNGSFPELLRTTPGARRSANPGASCAALGGRAEWFTADHALDYGYGPASPFGKLVEARGKTLLLGAPLHTMTLLHHAEHLAQIPGKRILSFEAPIQVQGKVKWRNFEEFDTSLPVVAGLEENYFAQIVEAFLQMHSGRTGLIGNAHSIVVEAPAVVRFATDWLEQRVSRSL